MRWRCSTRSSISISARIDLVSGHWEWINRSSAVTTLWLGLPAIAGTISFLTLPTIYDAVVVTFLIMGSLYFSINSAMTIIGNSYIDTVITDGCQVEISYLDGEIGVRVAVIFKNFAPRVASYSINSMNVVIDGRTVAQPKFNSVSGSMGPGEKCLYWYETINLPGYDRTTSLIGQVEVHYIYGSPRNRRWSSTAKYQINLTPDDSDIGFLYDWRTQFDV